MNTFEALLKTNKELAEKIKSQGYFLQKEDVEKLAELSRLAPVLVRCSNGRFTCPVQDALHFCKIIGESKEDYVRDISFMIC